VRKRVCEAITLLAANDLASIEKYFDSVCEFMLQATADLDESVALEACEFWSTLVISQEGQEGLQKFLPRLIPLLISRMRLTETQIMLDRIEEDEHASGEKELNIKPLHYRGKNNEKDEEDNDDGESSSAWTLRRQSAVVFDNIAVVYNSELILPYALTSISVLLQSEDTWNRECGMLALGALSRGCQDKLGEFIPQIYPFLLESLSNPTPEVRSIACWTLGRFCYAIIDQEDERVGNENLAKLLQVLLPVMLDSKPKVQSASCSALCTIMEDAGERICYFSTPILINVDLAFKMYGVKNSLLLCDTLGTLADQIGNELAHAQHSELYLPHLMRSFESYDDTSYYLFPIMECLTSVIAVIGIEFHKYAPATLSRCLRIVNATMAANAAADAGQWSLPTDPPPKDFAICALDVLSSLAEGLGHPAFSVLITGNETNVLELLFCCMKDTMDAVRQSSFSLAGDLCKVCIELVLPVRAQLLTLALGNIDIDAPMVCNNALWTIGELAIRIDGGDMAPFIPRIMQCLIQVLHKLNTLPLNLKQNVAITLGRLCVTNTDTCAELLPEYFVNWCRYWNLTYGVVYLLNTSTYCRSLSELEPSEEQAHAYAGLCAAVSSNPLIFSIAGTFDAFILACASLENTPDEPLRSNITNILKALLSVSEASWRNLMRTNRKQIEHLTNIFQMTG
jgi:transportin-1